ncbi:FMN-binding negative transcriptional regulator [Salegentibacter chungangensis]|uniref:FMN-binding negative transcriptional regulator n=1 Tax=Salegentibacter chungangensis TaxID=1335724 RepID=A0ABW3NP57_9FLAO
MYQPKRYRKNDPGYIFEFIKKYPFAAFVIQGTQLLATHIPVLAEGDADNFRLYSHIANHNEQLQHLKNDTEALLIFQGPQAYVSSSWYKEKDISTWDYSAVHINVKLKLQTEDELRSSLKKLVSRFEKLQEKPLYYEEIPRKILEAHLPEITGFWGEPVKIQAIAKHHQGYREEDVRAVCRHLEKQNDPLAAGLSENIKNEHFS